MIISLSALFVVLCNSHSIWALSPAALASQYSLTTSTTLPFPTATTIASSFAQADIVEDWGLAKGRIQDGASNLNFVSDPVNTTAQGPALEVTYPAGSYSHDTGGAQLINLWNSTDSGGFQSMMVSYDIAFEKDFDWVKGGKLPGLRGGPASSGCSGGNQPTGSDCFSTRLMWRPNGLGEAYAYMQRGNNLCNERGITCNDDFGISVQRGALVFTPGTWHTISLLVQLNNPVNVANGNLVVYLDGSKVIQQSNLQFRKSSAVMVGGLYFSTFFGGSSDDWATPQTTHTYYRNLTLWGSGQPSNLTGLVVSGAQRTSSVALILTFMSIVATTCISIL